MRCCSPSYGSRRRDRDPAHLERHREHRNDVTQLFPLAERRAGRARQGRGPRKQPDRVLADRGYDHDKYRRELRLRGVGSEIARRNPEHARASAAPAGWFSAPSPGYTTSNGCSSATTAAARSTKPSSRSAAISSASGGFRTHCDSTSYTVVMVWFVLACLLRSTGQLDSPALTSAFATIAVVLTMAALSAIGLSTQLGKSLNPSRSPSSTLGARIGQSSRPQASVFNG